MSPSRRAFRLIAMTAVTCTALAASAALTSAKDPKWFGPISQTPGTLGQATVELKIHFGRKSHKSKKLVPKSLLAKEHSVYYNCLNGQSYYPGAGGGDALDSAKLEIEETIFVKKKGTFNITDTTVGDTESFSFNLQGRIAGRTASGTLRLENHENDGSRPPGDIHTCDTGVLPWTASAP
jgi:hypothetical protein